MIEKYQEALQEFKRVDHLYHVSLKYTRTVDVIRSMVERLISTYENSIATILLVLKEEGKIADIPENPVGAASLLLEHMDEEDSQVIGIYLDLRKIMRIPFTSREEFRRHVTMVVEREDKPNEIDIDLLGEYYDLTAKFLSYTKTKIEPYKDQL